MREKQKMQVSSLVTSFQIFDFHESSSVTCQLDNKIEDLDRRQQRK